MKMNCEDCIHYSYDDEYECYICDVNVNLDQDEAYKFISGTLSNCPYFRFGDDYTIVKKQN